MVWVLQRAGGEKPTWLKCDFFFLIPLGAALGSILASGGFSPDLLGHPDTKELQSSNVEVTHVRIRSWLPLYVGMFLIFIISCKGGGTVPDTCFMCEAKVMPSKVTI